MNVSLCFMRRLVSTWSFDVLADTCFPCRLSNADFFPRRHSVSLVIRTHPKMREGLVAFGTFLFVKLESVGIQL